MQTKAIAAAFAAILLTAGAIQANVFNLGGTRNADGSWTGVASLETVHVGDPGNIGELSGSGAGGYAPTRICGAVDYEYNIGKYEVTAGQYCAFLNAVAATDTYALYNTKMVTVIFGCQITQNGTSGNYTYDFSGRPSGTEESNWVNRPVNFVSFWDACRFANWLHNGQPTGAQGPNTTERGAYTLDGYNGNDGRTIQRNTNAIWAVTSEDEWYKAAYYKGGSTNAGYWDYPTSSDTRPGWDTADASGNNANYMPGSFALGPPYYRNEVGEFQNSDSPYGTFDQAGNEWEWNEAIIGSFRRGMRGSSFYDQMGMQSCERSIYGDGVLPLTEGNMYGFRVSEVPEPVSLALLALGGLALLRRKGYEGKR